MTQNRKTFGMTSMQLAILAGLGGAACLLFAVTGWLVFGGSLNIGFSRPPTETATPVLTPTIYVIPTFTPTVTPTPIPYEQLIPNGWKQFKTELVELWLPPSFKAVKKDADEELSLEGSNSPLYNMRVGVSFKPLVGDSLDAFLDAELLKLDPQIRLVERRTVSVNGTDAVRIMFEARIETVDVNQLTYVFQDGGTVWFVIYIAQINEFYEMLPTFEQSAETFRVVR